jgi:hypothetical protein
MIFQHKQYFLKGDSAIAIDISFLEDIDCLIIGDIGVGNL